MPSSRFNKAKLRTGMLATAAALAFGSAAVAQTSACATADYATQAQTFVQSLAKANQFSGSVLVARNGKPVFRQAFGMADLEWNVANTPDTKFRLGSNTKQFTATAILQLAEQGKLSVDDPVSKYYPDAPAARSKITIKHLLTHTSGIPTYTAIPKDFDTDFKIHHTPEELIKLTQDKPLDFEPGSKYAYDNSGYVLLGYIVEKVSGQPYADYLQAHIFGPLGMKNSGYDSSERIIPQRASGYQPGSNGAWINTPYLDMSVPYAAGSLYSTVDDMLIWDQALLQDRPLKAASLQQMYTDYGHNYGFGWVIDKQFGKDRVSHSGGVNGFVSEFERYPKDGLTVVVLSNFAGSATGDVASSLAGLCLGDTAAVAGVQHFEAQTASPGTEAALRRNIDELKRGQPDYTKMSDFLASVTSQQLTGLQKRLTDLGDVVSVKFTGVTAFGLDIYEVDFAKGKTQWRISLTPDGKTSDVGLRPLP